GSAVDADHHRGDVAVAFRRDLHHQLLVEDTVLVVVGIARPLAGIRFDLLHCGGDLLGEVHLGDQQGGGVEMDAEVDVDGAADVPAGVDGGERAPPLGVADLEAAQVGPAAGVGAARLAGEAGVGAGRVGVPDVDHRVADRRAVV